MQEAELETSTPAPQLRKQAGSRPELKWCLEGVWVGVPGEAAQDN